MEWIKLISAAGIGSIIIKLLDILWLQKINKTNDHRKWLREQRLKAYSKLISELLSLKMFDLSLLEKQGLVEISDAILLASPDVSKQIENLYAEVKTSLKEFVSKRQQAQVKQHSFCKFVIPSLGFVLLLHC